MLAGTVGIKLRQRVHHAFGREDHDNFCAFPQLGQKLELAAVQFDEAAHDRQAKSGAFVGVLLRH